MEFKIIRKSNKNNENRKFNKIKERGMEENKVPKGDHKGRSSSSLRIFQSITHIYLFEITAHVSLRRSALFCIVW